MTVHTGGVTERFTITVSAMVLVGSPAGADDDEKALHRKLEASPRLEQRMVSIIIDSSDTDLHVFSENLDAKTAIDTLIALTARVAHQVDEEIHRRS